MIAQDKMNLFAGLSSNSLLSQIANANQSHMAGSGGGGAPPPRAFLPSFSSLAASLASSSSTISGAPPLPIFLPSTSPLQTPATPTTSSHTPFSTDREGVKVLVPPLPILLPSSSPSSLLSSNLLQGTSSTPFDLPSTSRISSTSTLSTSPSTPIKGERCVGCGSESAIRVHYGAPSCHGCKAFFRRSVFEGRHYACSAENHCEITNESRNRCRSCRFRNCLEGGMNPKHVREERSKTDRLIQERIKETSPSIPSTRTPSSTPIEEQQITIFLIALERQCEQLTDEDASTEQSQLHEIARQVTTNPSLQNIARVRRRPMIWTCERIMADDDISSAWYRAFVLLADWAMSIPEFRLLTSEDQNILFRQNFMTFAWLHYAYKCYSNGHVAIGTPIGNGSYIPYQEAVLATMDPKWMSTYGLLGRKVIDIVVKPMIEMEVDEEEYCLLKTIALFQPDNTLSESGSSIASRQRDKLLEALAIHIERRFPHLSPAQKVSRAIKSTLLFPALITISQFETSFTQNLSAAEIVSLCGLPGDILKTI